MSMNLTPDLLSDYQNRMVDFIKCVPKCALWVDMGLGKTVSTLTALSDLFKSIECNRVLVIAPLRVAKTTWPDEIEQWEHTKWLTYSVACGDEKTRIKAISEDTYIHIINRENVQWLVQYLKNKWPYDTIIIDEASSFRTPSSKRFRSLRRVARRSMRVIELTGTPTPKGVINLWSQIYLLDNGERLGQTLTYYRDRWFTPDYNGYEWTPKKHAEKEIREQVSDLVLSIGAEDHIKLPDVNYKTEEVILPANIRKKYKELEKETILEIQNEVIVAANAAVLSGKLRQCVNGALYTDDLGNYIELHDEKLKALDRIIARYPDQPILVGYNFKSDLERIRKRYPCAEVLSADPSIIRKWNDKKISILLAHPASAGHGLNLQFGGSIAVWFGKPWDLELYLQFNARLARRGQKHPVTIYGINALSTVDDVVEKILTERTKGQKNLLNELKNSLAEDLEQAA